MRNEKLLPYETIVQATGGEPEAVSCVMRYYSVMVKRFCNTCG